MKILVKDEDSRSRMYRGGQMALESMGVISNSNGFDNELEILASSNISGRVVKALKLYVSYELEGSIRKHELYKNNPYIVDMPENQLDELESVIAMRVSRRGSGLHVEGKLFVPKAKEPMTFERDVNALPGSFSTPVGTVTLQRIPVWRQPTVICLPQSCRSTLPPSPMAHASRPAPPARPPLWPS